MDKKVKQKIRVLSVFLIIMIVFTILSRAAASVLVAQVCVEKPGRGKLSFSCSGEGTVVPGQEKVIFLWPGQQVEWAAETGSTVKAGECLIQFRLEYLQQAIQSKQVELTQLEIQAQQQQISARGTARVLSAERAKQALDEARKRLAEAQKKETEAQKNYNTGQLYTGHNGGSGIPILDNASMLPQTRSTASTKNNSAVLPQNNFVTPLQDNAGTSLQGDPSMPLQDDSAKPPQDDSTVPPQDDSAKPPQDNSAMPPQDDSAKPPQDDSAVPPQDDSAKPPQDDCDIPLQDGYDEIAARQQELESALQQAKADVEAARQAVDQAQTDYDFALKEDAAQNINEANAIQSAQLGAESLNVQAEQARQALNELIAYQNAGGKICAEQDCTVLACGVTAGTFTTGAEVLVTGSGGWKLKGLAETKDRERLKAGADAEIRLGTGKKRTVRIESTAMERTQSGSAVSDSSDSSSLQFCWYTRLPENAVAENGNTFTWTVDASSDKEYEQLIPLSALREDTAGAYCLILSEEKTMLGTVQTAKKVPVTVLEKDTRKAAVTSALKETDQIIVSSEKYVEEGDRVRIKE